jgi:hypothetical protein
MNTVAAIFLNLLSTTFLLGLFFVLTSIFLDSAWVFLNTVTSILWDLTRVVLVAMITGSAGALLIVLLSQQLLRLVPGRPLVLLGLGGDDLGDSGAVSVFHFHNSSSDLSLVLLSDDSVADVEDCFLSISSNLLLSATPSVSSSMFPNYWGTFI